MPRVPRLQFGALLTQVSTQKTRNVLFRLKPRDATLSNVFFASSQFNLDAFRHSRLLIRLSHFKSRRPAPLVSRIASYHFMITKLLSARRYYLRGSRIGRETSWSKQHPYSIVVSGYLIAVDISRALVSRTRSGGPSPTFDQQTARTVIAKRSLSTRTVRIRSGRQ